MAHKAKTNHKKYLSRRKFMSASAVGSASLLAACDCKEKCGVAASATGPAIHTRGKQRRLKMVTTWPRNFPGLGDGAENVAQFITEMSGGAIHVELFAANELVGAFEAFDAVSGGAVDMYHGPEYYWNGKHPAYPFFTSVPFGMTATEIMGWVEYGGGQALWDELAARFHIKPFAAGNTGQQMGGWYKREIKTLEDLRGLKIRMPGIGGEVMRRAGASAVAIPGGEIYQALQSGAIDATEWVGPWNDVAFGLYREARYYYWPGFHEPGAMLAIGMNLDVWNTLTPQEQSIVQNACRASNNQMIAQYVHFNGVSLKTLVEKHNVQLRQMPDSIMQALAHNTKPVLEEIAATDAISQRIYTAYRSALKASMDWHRLSEEAYFTSRRRFFDL